MSRYIEINGVIELPDNVYHDQFWTVFLLELIYPLIHSNDLIHVDVIDKCVSSVYNISVRRIL